MKNLTKWSLFIAIATVISLSSCEKNEITSISINKTTIGLNLGKSDTLVATVNFTGEITNIPVNWSVDNNRVVSVSETGSETMSKSGGTRSIQKKVVITALQTGTAKVTLGSGEKTISCDITVEQREFTFNHAHVSNWGDYYDIEHNNFDMYLLESSLSFDTGGKLTGNGVLLYLDFNVPITQDELAEGSFTAANNGNINTFFPGERYNSGNAVEYGGARIIEVEGGLARNITLIESGHFAFVPDGEKYRIGGEMTTEYGEKIVFTFSGTTTLSDKKEIPVEINPALTKGDLEYFGDAYRSGSSNFVAYLMSEQVNLSAQKISGEMLMLEFNTSILATNSIPVGTYTMISRNESMSPLTLVYGFTSEKNENWGCWYYNYNDTTVKKLKTGYAKVSKSEKTYTIQYELYDRFGSKVYGTYTGTLNFIQSNQALSLSRTKIQRKMPNIRLKNNKYFHNNKKQSY
ncbi:MAG: hypothetical protein PHG64_08165 [Paludibacter sp.]|nr:hypothetical protein [Paludibacter sp.]